MILQIVLDLLVRTLMDKERVDLLVFQLLKTFILSLTDY